MESWLRGLLDLRDVFKARAGDDLHYLTVHKVLPHKEWLAIGGDAEAKSILTLPEGEIWHDERLIFGVKPILLDETSSRMTTAMGGRESTEENPEILICRHILFGKFTDDASASASLDDFKTWAGDAGRYVLTRPENPLKVVWEPTWLIWMNWMTGLANHRYVGSGLERRWWEPLGSHGGFRMILPTNVFRASLDTINFTVEHKDNQGGGGAKPAQIPPDTPQETERDRRDVAAMELYMAKGKAGKPSPGVGVCITKFDGDSGNKTSRTTFMDAVKRGCKLRGIEFDMIKRKRKH